MAKDIIGKDLPKKKVLIKHVDYKKVPDVDRPVQVSITGLFAEEGSRRVSRPDIEKAGIAAATAFKSYLENRLIPYSLLDVEVETEYRYVQLRSKNKV